jgi:uncharacterized repeat protein (TIGR02543 family)
LRKFKMYLCGLLILIMNFTVVFGLERKIEDNENERNSPVFQEIGDSSLAQAPSDGVTGSLSGSGSPLKEQRERTSKKSDTIVLRLKDLKKLGQLNISEKILAKYDDMGAAVLEIPKGGNPDKIIEKYKKNPLITDVYQDSLVEQFYTPTDPLYKSHQWNLKRIGMEPTWDITRGNSSVVVAIIDSGLSLFSDIDGVLKGADVSGNSIREDTYVGQYSYEGSQHGTAIASLIGSNLNNIGLAGIAPDVSILPVKAFYDGTSITTATKISAGIRWAADRGANIINLSLGTNSEEPLLREAVQYAQNKGALIVAASGNNGFSSFVSYPASYDGVIAVGSTKDTGESSAFSNYGQELKLLAPGENIYLANYSAGGTSYAYFTGTSFAAPTVTAVAALLKSKYPGYSNEKITKILYTGTDDGNYPGWDAYTGYGTVNAEKVMAVAKAFTDEDGNDTSETAHRVEMNNTMTGKIFPVGDRDFYKFTLEEPNQVEFNLTTTGTGDLVIDVYNAAGFVVARIDDGRHGEPEFLRATLDKGEYRVRIKDVYGSWDFADYKLQITVDDKIPPLISVLKDGVAVSNGFISARDLTVSIRDTSAFTTLLTRNNATYGWPLDGVFRENGKYMIRATDTSGNFSSFEFGIDKEGLVNIDYNTQGGNVIPSQQIARNSTMDAPAIPFRAGHEFRGWFREAEGTTPWDFKSDLVTKDTTLFAKWSVNSYTVSFDSAGGSQVSNMTVVFNSILPVPVKPERPGYLFLGWYRDSVYKEVWNFASEKVTTNLTLYARWSSPLEAPSTLKAVSVPSNSIKVSWNPINNVTGYKIYRSTTLSGTYAYVGATRSLEFVNSGLELNRTYYYKVRSYRTEDTHTINSDFSSAALATTTLAMPTKVEARQDSVSSIKLKWTASPGASGYKVYRSLTPNGSYSYVGFTTALEYVNKGLTMGTTYYYRLRAFTSDVTPLMSDFSATSSAQLIPSPPQVLDYVITSNKSVKLKWNAVAGVTGYKVYRLNNSMGTYDYMGATKTLEFNDVSVTYGNTYFYKLKSYYDIPGGSVSSPFSQIIPLTIY